MKNTILFTLALLLFSCTQDADIVQQGFFQAPALPVDPPQLADDTVVDPDPVERYWYCYVDYWVTDTAQGGVGVPGGQVYRYLYPYPGRLMIRSVYRPTENTIDYVPEALRALGLQAEPAYVRAYTFGQ